MPRTTPKEEPRTYVLVRGPLDRIHEADCGHLKNTRTRQGDETLTAEQAHDLLTQSPYSTTCGTCRPRPQENA